MAVMAIAAALLIHIGISLYAGAVVFQTFFGTQCNGVDRGDLACDRGLYGHRRIDGCGGHRNDSDSDSSRWRRAGNSSGNPRAAEAGIHSLAEFREAMRPHQLSMIRTSNEDGYAWYAFLLGYPVIGIWYWCTDQTIVQRALGAKDQFNAQNGALFAGLLKSCRCS